MKLKELPALDRLAVKAVLAIGLSLFVVQHAWAEVLPEWLQGRWVGRSCIVESVDLQMPPKILRQFELRLKEAVLTVGESRYTMVGSNITHMTLAEDVTVSPSRKRLRDLLEQVKIQVPAVVGAAVDLHLDETLEGVTLKVGRCNVLPAQVVGAPGGVRPPNLPLLSTKCHDVDILRLQGDHRILIPGDGAIPCLEILERE